MENLTNARVNSISKQGLHGDGQTLYLRVAKSGRKSWIQRVTIEGCRHDIGLGPYPDTTLKMARQRALHNRIEIWEGRDPLAKKREAQVPTFRDAAQQTFDTNKIRWRSGKHTRTWLQSLEKHAFPFIGDMRVDRIGRRHVIRVLKPIWEAQPEVARKLMQRIRKTLDWCEANELIPSNPVTKGIDAALPAMPSVKAHFRALPHAEVRESLDRVRSSNSSPIVKLCFEIVVLTGVRSGEARCARWSEIDLGKRFWIIPATRMKANAEHSVPLSDQAVTVLEKASQFRDGSDLVFPSPRTAGKPMSDMTLTKVLRTTGLAEKTTEHGYRSSFRTWGSECTDIPDPILEMALAHRVGTQVEQIYKRTDLREHRRSLMQQWADYVAPEAVDERTTDAQS